MSDPLYGVKFVWRDGMSFSRLSKALFDRFKAIGLTFGRISIKGGPGSGLFQVTRCRCEPPVPWPHGPWENTPGRKLIFSREFTDSPWNDDPWPKPDTWTAEWSVLEDPKRNREWGYFIARMEWNVPCSPERRPSEIHVLRMAFEQDFVRPCAETAEDFRSLCTKYREIKELYKLLGCDEVFAEYHGVTDDLRRRLPMYRYMDFRLAKEGTQVLVKRLEEGRLMPELDWLHSRIFIDPRGSVGLSPEEYLRINS